MKTRILTSVVGIGILAAVLWWVHTPVLPVAVGLLAIIASWEIFHAVGFGTRDLYLLVPVAVVDMMVMLTAGETLQLIAIPMVTLMAVYLAVCLIRKSQEISFEKLGSVVFFSGVALLGFYSLRWFAYALPADTYHQDAVYFILLGLCFAWGGDTGAYFIGRSFGKHKLAPIVSPKKTVEGAFGGVLGSILGGLLLTFIFRAAMGSETILAETGDWYYLALVILGALASVLGMVGDLFASVIKRQHQIKDYGHLFPGHGGVMDRFDSVLFIAPLVSGAVRLALYFGLF